MSFYKLIWCRRGSTDSIPLNAPVLDPPEGLRFDGYSTSMTGSERRVAASNELDEEVKRTIASWQGEHHSDSSFLAFLTCHLGLRTN